MGRSAGPHRCPRSAGTFLPSESPLENGGLVALPLGPSLQDASHGSSEASFRSCCGRAQTRPPRPPSPLPGPAHRPPPPAWSLCSCNPGQPFCSCHLSSLPAQGLLPAVPQGGFPVRPLGVASGPLVPSTPLTTSRMALLPAWSLLVACVPHQTVSSIRAQSGQSCSPSYPLGAGSGTQWVLTTHLLNTWMPNTLLFPSVSCSSCLEAGV